MAWVCNPVGYCRDRILQASCLCSVLTFQFDAIYNKVCWFWKATTFDAWRGKLIYFSFFWAVTFQNSNKQMSFMVGASWTRQTTTTQLLLRWNQARMLQHIEHILFVFSRLWSRILYKIGFLCVFLRLSEDSSSSQPACLPVGQIVSHSNNKENTNSDFTMIRSITNHNTNINN